MLKAVLLLDALSVPEGMALTVSSEKPSTPHAIYISTDSFENTTKQKNKERNRKSNMQIDQKHRETVQQVV